MIAATASIQMNAILQLTKALKAVGEADLTFLQKEVNLNSLMKIGQDGRNQAIRKQLPENHSSKPRPVMKVGK